MARLFHASTDKIQVGSGGPSISNDFSMFIMVKPNSFGATQFLQYIGSGVDGGNGFGLYIHSDGTFRIDIAFVADVNSGLRAKVNEWNRVALVRRSSDNKWLIFANGRKSTATATNNSNSPNGFYTLGARTNSSGTSSSPAKGAIAKAAFWNTPLTDSELFALTTGRVEPINLRRGLLAQNHELYGRGSTEKPLFAGSTLTATGTLSAEDPPLIDPLNFRRLMTRNAKAGNTPGLLAKVGSIASATGTGNQITTGLGFQPKVVLFWGNGATADGFTGEIKFNFGVGISSTKRINTQYSAQDVTSGPDVSMGLDTTKCIKFIDIAAATLSAADLSSLDLDGFTLNWTTADASARIVNYMALGGADITNVNTGNFQMAASTGNQSVTGLGFRPDAIMFFSTAAATAPDFASVASSGFRFGMATGTSNRGAMSEVSIHNANPTTTRITQSASRCIIQNSGSAIEAAADLVSFDADGFTINWVTNTGSQRPYIGYVAFKGGQFKVGTFNGATSTGNASTTGIGFTPKVLLLATDGQATSSSNVSDGRSILGAGSSSSARGMTWMQDGTAQSGTSRAKIDLQRDQIYQNEAFFDSTPTQRVDLVSLDSDGFTLNWQVASATATEMLYFVAGNAATPSTYPGLIGGGFY